MAEQESEPDPPGETPTARPARPSRLATAAADIEFLKRIAAQSPGRAIRSLPNSGLRDREHAQDIKLKKMYAVSVLVVLGAQVVAADTLVFLYAALGVGWKMHTSVLEAWLAATVIEVVGVVLVVTRNLFPRRDPAEA